MQKISDEQLYQSTELLAELLIKKGLTLATAESCTGGWLAKCCTDLAGSSAWFEGGIVSYSNDIKQNILGVPSATLEEFGAVSKQTAIEMAKGALTKTQANLSVAITGIAGPTGGSKNKPVGTVCFAWNIDSTTITTEQQHFHGDRESIRRQAVMNALRGLIKNARD